MVRNSVGLEEILHGKFLSSKSKSKSKSEKVIL